MSFLDDLFEQFTPQGAVYFLHPDCPAFKGHFPGNPLLPAVVQAGLCVDAFSRRSGKAYELAQIKRAKFMRPLLPGVRVTVAWIEKSPLYLQCTLTSLDGVCYSRLQIVLKERV